MVEDNLDPVLSWTPRPSQSIKSSQWVKNSKSIVDRVNLWCGISAGQAPGDSGHDGHSHPIETETESHSDSNQGPYLFCIMKEKNAIR